MAPPAMAFSSTVVAANAIEVAAEVLISSHLCPRGSTALHYRNYRDSYTYTDDVDVDGGRVSLRYPPRVGPPSAAPPLPKEERSIVAPRRRRSASRVASAEAQQRRVSPIVHLRSIQDYHRQVLNEPNQMCITRFSAPWCKVCQSTNVAWERMASKILSALDDDNKNNIRIKFLAVSLDGKDEESTDALKDMLQINRVPQGVIHHPTQGVFGQKIDLTRSNLSILKKELVKYVGEDWMGSWMVLDGLKGEYR
eukprot:CAMPEP_0181104342 /NCGR_PEP_ID=MMETSP1071-20121207/15373_1 /TAXON_ID=35127 /ORGANISM="Thalassiosira sp., Strain NH16" /LENGTH=251 /DNA_ID=CAMNT_0023187527 /DNA_START=114 /DNA_END=869 /DNA_ORIENTATION=+